VIRIPLQGLDEFLFFSGNSFDGDNDGKHGATIPIYLAAARTGLCPCGTKKGDRIGCPLKLIWIRLD